jgi:hypothetical protein
VAVAFSPASTMGSFISILLFYSFAGLDSGENTKPASF